MATTPSNRRNTGIPMPKERDAAANKATSKAAKEAPAARQGAIEMPSRPKADTSVAAARANKIAGDAAAKAAAIAAAAKRATSRPEKLDGPRRSEGGITTPNGVQNVTPDYRNQG